jgi:hypothetical protein
MVVLRGTKLAYEPYCDDDGELTSMVVVEQLSRERAQVWMAISSICEEDIVCIAVSPYGTTIVLSSTVCSSSSTLHLLMPERFAKMRPVMGLSWL